MSENSLFPQTPEFDPPAASPTRPRIFIRRLQIRGGPGIGAPVIRDIPFDAGINIIATVEPPHNDERVAGHSVGKTLLLRMLRYCLGEPTFGQLSVQTAVSHAFPDGYVAVTVDLDGHPWSVARPIGLDRSPSQCFAARNRSIEQLFEEPEMSRDYHNFDAELTATGIAGLESIPFVKPDRTLRWPELLAWIARDQECRFRGSTDWRDPKADSKITSPSVSDAHRIMRAAMGVFGEQEQILQQQHDQLISQKAELKTLTDRQQVAVEVEQSRLEGLLTGISEQPPGQLVSAFLSERADQATAFLNRERADVLIANDTSDAEGDLQDKESLWVAATQSLAVLRADLKAQKARQANYTDDLMQEQNQNLGAIRFRCSFGYATIEDAKAHNCPGNPSELQPNTERIESLKSRLLEIEESITALENQIEEAVDSENTARDAVRDAKQHLQHLREQRSERLRELDQHIGSQVALADRARAHSEEVAIYTQREQQLEELSTQIEASAANLRDTRSETATALRTLSHGYDQIVRRLLEADSGGSIDIDKGRLVATLSDQLRTAGQAMETVATVLGFDLACLLGYIHGLGYLPGLWIHDSPREADMEDALYARFFNVLQEMSGLFSERAPSFQYIVATTTRPPRSMDIFVRLDLDARSDNGLLLKKRL